MLDIRKRGGGSLTRPYGITKYSSCLDLVMNAVFHSYLDKVIGNAIF